MGHGRGTDLLLGIEPLTDFGDLAALQVADLLQEFLDRSCDIGHPTDPFDVSVTANHLSRRDGHDQAEMVEDEFL